MNKLLLIAVVIAALFAPMTVHAAATVTQDVDSYVGGFVVAYCFCVGDVVSGTNIDTDTMAIITGDHYLYSVTAYPTSGGVAPDAADVFVLNEDGEDLLGSADGGTTANKGANLIDATLTKTAFPYSNHTSTWYFAPVTGQLTLRVYNQIIGNAEYTIKLVFTRQQ